MDNFYWTMDDILAATGGELLAKKNCPEFGKVSIDSRHIDPADLFVAVEGLTHDGHTFIPEIVQKGVRGIVADREKAGPVTAEAAFDDVCWILVDDTVRALGDLAAFHRNRFHIPVVCITGSNGKTTTKEMTASVLEQKFATLKTLGNFNNEFGVPLTLFRMNHTHEAAVLELGMNHPGEIRRLSEICRPDFGIITNIGPAHLEGLGTVSDVMHAKGELMENIRPDGVVILNGDDSYGLRLGGNTRHKVTYFGQSIYADVRAVDIRQNRDAMSFTLELPNEKVPVTVHAPGHFMVSNALAAAAVGYLVGLDTDEIKSGIEAFRPVKGRMDVKEARSGFFIIDDSYNANPGSMEAAIKTLVSLKGSGKGALVAGDMLELGETAAHFHEQIGETAARLGVDRIFVTGDFADAVKKGAQAQKMTAANIVTGDKEVLVKSLAEFLGPGDWVLVKGSRGSKMDDIVRQLEDKDGSSV